MKKDGTIDFGNYKFLRCQSFSFMHGNVMVCTKAMLIVSHFLSLKKKTPLWHLTHLFIYSFIHLWLNVKFVSAKGLKVTVQIRWCLVLWAVPGRCGGTSLQTLSQEAERRKR